MEVLVLVLESWTHRRRMATRCRWHRGMAWRLCARKRASASWSRWTTVTVLDARGSGDRTRAPWRGRVRGSAWPPSLPPSALHSSLPSLGCPARRVMAYAPPDTRYYSNAFDPTRSTPSVVPRPRPAPSDVNVQERQAPQVRPLSSQSHV